MSAVSALLARDLIKIYRGRRVLDRVSLTAAPGDRIGLVGENGVGKSTLLRLLAGVEEPDGGEVLRPADTGLLEQELRYCPAATVGTVMADALAEIRAALRRLAALAELLAKQPDDGAALAEYGDVLDWAECHQAWDAERRAELVLAGLGLADMATHRRLDTLSGGQRSRLGLAALLVRQPQALLLDEPTNHLDDDVVAFLEGHLRELPGVIVVASHDRMFLDAVCTDICDLDPTRAGITRYGGSYSDYLQAKRAERRRWEQDFAAQQDEIAALRAAVAVTARRVAHGRPMRDRNKPAYDRHGSRVQSSISSRVRNARQRLDHVLASRIAKPPAPLQFSSAVASKAGDELNGPVLALREVRVPDRLAVDALDIPAGGRLLITGPNGAGKSTLLAVLAGRLHPSAGIVHRRPGVQLGLLEQDVWFPAAQRSARHTYQAAVGNLAEQVPLTSLGLLAPADLDRPVGELSVGQRRRLALAMLVARRLQVLLLDEPTNHISLTLAQELEDALRAAPGTIVVATHDRWQRRHWRGAHVRLDAGRLIANADAA